MGSSRTRELWTQQDRHHGDRVRLFRAVADVAAAHTVLYPGSFVDVAASVVFPSVTYVDTDRRAAAFFADRAGVREVVAEQPGAVPDPAIRFVHADYTSDLGLGTESFDLLVSLFAGFVSEHGTDYLRVGGTLLVNSSHGDAAMASIDPRYRLTGVVLHRSGRYRVVPQDLDAYLVPRASVEVTPELLHRTGRGVAYTKAASCYLFQRIR